ncbi:ABC transporter permease [Paenibacillus solani]|uniref:ABC transporter permease n=1 Tax=Paenibacillus solani TaxID=1705565 RepID=UPI003D28165E
MKKLIVLISAGVKTSFQFRFKVITDIIFNGVYLFILYFVWKAIYVFQPSIEGSTFHETYAYIALATVISFLFTSRTDWKMSLKVMDGTIISYYFRPIPIFLQFFMESIGSVIIQFFSLVCPVVILLVTFGFTNIGINLPFFMIALLMGFVISFSFDYMIGTVSFYTESLWGIIMFKSTLVAFLSGSLMPLKFYPEYLQDIIAWLPFRAIISLPLEIILGRNIQIDTIMEYLGIQLFWMVIIINCALFVYKRLERVLTINGG